MAFWVNDPNQLSVAKCMGGVHPGCFKSSRYVRVIVDVGATGANVVRWSRPRDHATLTHRRAAATRRLPGRVLHGRSLPGGDGHRAAAARQAGRHHLPGKRQGAHAGRHPAQRPAVEALDRALTGGAYRRQNTRGMRGMPLFSCRAQPVPGSTPRPKLVILAKDLASWSAVLLEVLMRDALPA